jgi:hypothetical protein
VFTDKRLSRFTKNAKKLKKSCAGRLSSYTDPIQQVFIVLQSLYNGPTNVQTRKKEIFEKCQADQPTIKASEIFSYLELFQEQYSAEFDMQ